MARYGRNLRTKILKSVFFSVALPAFALMVAFFVAWNFYMRERIVRELEASTAAMAGRMASDLAAYDGLLKALAADRRLSPASSGGGRQDFSWAMARVYATMRNCRLRGAVRFVGADGRNLFSTMGEPLGSGDDQGDRELGWGLYGLMRRSPGSVVGYQRAMRYGGLLETDYSLGLAVPGPEGEISGYLVADLSFRGSETLPSGPEDGVTGRFILANEFDRVVASFDGSSITSFDRFAIGGARGETSLGGARYAFARVEVGGHGLVVYGLSSIEFIISSFRFGLYTIGVIIVLTSIVFVFVLAASVKRITRPMNEIIGAMEKVSRGDFSARLEVVSGDEFEEMALRLNSLIAEMESTVARLVEGIELAKTAEMKELQAQFNPHFLYNTIDTAKWMMRMGETEKASQMLTNMAKVLRYSIHDRPAESTVALREDIAAMKTYLAIHELSMGDKLAIDYDIDESLLSCRVPKLLIQPIVENALIHGIGATGSGRLGISIRGEGGKLVIRVTDSGEGFAVDPEVFLRANATRDPGRADASADDQASGMGIGLVLRRARLQYGDRFSFSVRGGKGEESVVTLTIPMEPGGEKCTEL